VFAADESPTVAAELSLCSVAWETAPYGDFQRQTADDCRSAARKLLAPVLRDIFGPRAFRSVTIEPSWLTPEIIDLAQCIYENRRFEDMPLLANALEEAGCDNEEIPQHGRSGGEHVRGC
jgi:hypothetical protein